MTSNETGVSVSLPPQSSGGLDHLCLDGEWLATASTGCYAMGTVSGLNTRKYHGLLVVPMNPPVRRVMLLGRVEDFIEVGGRITGLHTSEYPGEISPRGYEQLQAFSAEPYPRWAYRVGDVVVEKTLRLCPRTASVVLSYTLLGGGGREGVSLELRPILPLRPIHELQRVFDAKLNAQVGDDGTFRVPATSRTPEVYFAHDGVFRPSGYWYERQTYRQEADRGYACMEDSWSPGVVRFTLKAGVPVHLVCSAEPVSLRDALVPLEQAEGKHQDALRAPVVEVEAGGDGTLSALLRAVEITAPTAESLESAPAQAPVRRGVWATTTNWPWGDVDFRQHLMGFEGIYCCTGRLAQGWSLIRGLVEHLRHGHLPDRIDERSGKPAYDGADISLWAIHAMHSLLSAEGIVGRHGSSAGRASPADEDRLQFCMLVADNICHAILAGHHPGLTSDDDRLVTVRAEGRPGTWMNAFGMPTYDGDLGWAVTPRAGRAVEVNALWYSALRITADLCMQAGREGEAARWATVALACKQSFNRHFWDEQAGYCHDVLTASGPEGGCRPSALWTVALPYAVLDPHRWHPLMATAERELLTPAGLRTLGASHPSYRGRCQGHAASRDAAMHQGSVHPFLLGVYGRAFLRVSGTTDANRARVKALIRQMLHHAGNWQQHLIPELLDGDAPHAMGAGAVASALSAGELLRCYVQDGLGAWDLESQPDAAAMERHEAAAYFHEWDGAGVGPEAS